MSDPAELQADEVGELIGAELDDTDAVSPGLLPSRVQGVAERHLDVSLHGTRLIGGEAGHRRASAERALAVTEGAEISFLSGHLTTGTPSGRALLGHELTHVAQQRAAGATAVQRKPADPEPAPATKEPAAPAPAGGGAAAGPDAQRADLLAREDKAFMEVQGRAGKPALDLVLSFPAKTPIEKEQVTIVGFASRVGDPPRRGFDSAGAATAYASLAAAGSGAVVIAQDKFFFVALVSASSRFRRTDVWKVEPYLGILAAIGVDGASFPLNVQLERDMDSAHLYDPEQAGPVAAEDLRAIAGVRIDEDQRKAEAEAKKAAEEGRPPPQPAGVEKVELTPAQEEAFILSYFRARGLEVLTENRAMVEKLAADFSPTNKGDVNTPSTGVSGAAKELIDSSRKFGMQYRELLEREAELAKYISLVEQERSFSGGAWTIKVGDKSDFIIIWLDRLKDKQKKVADGKMELLSRMPMLAQMVGTEREAPSRLGTLDQAAYWVGGNLVGFGEHLQTLWSDTIKSPTIYGENQYDESSFGKGASDEDLRKEFAGKLDGVRKAIRRARSDISGGDEGFLLGMASLRQRVAADLAGNAALKKRLDEMLSTHSIIEAVVSIGTAVIQIGLLFVPGGQLISAAIGMVQQIADTSQHLKEWNVSKAAIDPTRALVDQQQASEQLLWDTVMLAVQAADLAGALLGDAAKAAKVKEAAEVEKAGKEGGVIKNAAGEAEEVGGKTAVTPALERPEEIDKLAEDLLARSLKGTLPGTGAERAELLKDLVNQRLEHAGVFPIEVNTGKALGAKFDHTTWTMTLNLAALEETSISNPAFAKLVNHAYHEARHAEQFFLMARREAALNKSAAQIAMDFKAGGIELPPKVAEAAKDAPLDLASQEATLASKWHASIFGADRAARQKLLGEFEKVNNEMAMWKEKLEALGPHGDPAEISGAQAHYDTAAARQRELFPDYMALPEEADAWEVGEAAGKAYEDRVRQRPTTPPPRPAPIEQKQ